MASHPYKTLEYKGASVEIDELMVPLITALWDLGIQTTNCCQGDVDDTWHSAYVAMPISDFPKFFELLGPHLQIALANRRHNVYFGRTAVHEEGLVESLDAVFHAYEDGRCGRVDAVLRCLPSRLPAIAAAAQALAGVPA